MFQKTWTLTSNWTYYTYTFTASAEMESDLCTFHLGVTGSANISICGMKMELGEKATPYCPAIGEMSGNLVYDSSGYGHRAIPVGTITTIGSSPRYNVAANLDGASAIKCEGNEWMIQGIESLTLNFWAKAVTWPASGRLISCTESGGFNLEAGSSGYWRFSVHVYTNAEKTATAYKYDSKEIQISALKTNEWNMISLVYDTTGTKTYINGELHHTYTNTSYGIHFNTNARLFLGCEAYGASASSPYFTGQMSDFRIYTTALTPEALQELYHTSAAVDAAGNVYAREVVEI